MKKIKLFTSVVILAFVLSVLSISIIAQIETVNISEALQSEDDWFISQQHGTGDIEVGGGSLKIYGSGTGASYKNNYFHNKMIKMNVKIAGTTWIMIQLRNAVSPEDMAAATDSVYPWLGYGDPYVIFIVPETGALNIGYYNIGGLETIAADLAPGTFVKNQTYQLELGAIDEGNDTRIIVKVDGTDVYNDLVPEAGAKKPEGYFGILAYGEGDEITITGVQEGSNPTPAPQESQTPSDSFTQPVLLLTILSGIAYFVAAKKKKANRI